VTLPPRSWMEHANCRSHDPETWFIAERGPDGKNGRLREQAERRRRAMAVCDGCPVRAECLEYALRLEEPTGMRHGIWGGMDAAARRRVAESRGSGGRG